MSESATPFPMTRAGRKARSVLQAGVTTRWARHARKRPVSRFGQPPTSLLSSSSEAAWQRRSRCRTRGNMPPRSKRMRVSSTVIGALSQAQVEVGRGPQPRRKEAVQRFAVVLGGLRGGRRMHHMMREISPWRRGGQKRSRTRSARSRQSAWTRSLRSTCSTRAPRTGRRGERSRRRGGTSSAGACTCICARRRTTRPQRGRQPDGWPSTPVRAHRSEGQNPASGGPSRSRPRRRALSVCPRRRQRDRRRRAATRGARGSRGRLPPRV